MNFFARLRSTVFGPGRNYDLLAEEQEFHVEELTRELVAQGLAPDAARAQAERRFGNRAALRERSFDVEQFLGLAGWLRDARLGARGLLRRRGLAMTAITSLALGIGATSAVWSVVDAVLLRPLPLAEPDRLFVVQETARGEDSNSNPARLADWAERVSAFAAVAAFYGEELTLTGEGEPVKLRAERSVGRPLDVLGVQPLLGRGFSPQEERGEGARVALLGAGAWRGRFGGDPGVLGRALRLGGEPTTIVGVLPDALGYPPPFDVLLPAPRELQSHSRRAAFLQVVGRLRQGVDARSAQAEVETVAAQLAREYPATDAGRGARLERLAETLVSEARLPLLVLLGAVAAVLLIACTNVASLLLARAAERRREAAVRVALGAGRASLVRLYLVESGLLALGGGALGLILATLSLSTLVRLLPADTPGLERAHLDGRVLLFSLALSVSCGLAAGLLPAWRAAARAPADRMRDGSRAGRSAEGTRARRVLVGTQVTFTTLLLVAVGLLAKSLWRMQQAPLGFSPQGAVSLIVRFPWDTEKDVLERFSTEVIDGFAAVPGVTAAGVIDRLPLAGGTQSGPIAVAGQTLPADLASTEVSHRAASPGAFAALGIPLLRGRLPRTSSSGEAVVNDTLAARYFPAGDAVGRRITFDTRPEAGRAPRWFEIVGVVGTLRLTVAQRAPQAEIYVLPRDTYWPQLNFVVRAAGDPRTLAPALRSVVHRVDPEQPIDAIASLDDTVGAASAEASTRVYLLAGFACSALLLSAIGLYGVLASDVAERRRELGIRLALGAEPRLLLRQVVWRGSIVTGTGLAAGVLGALALGRWLGSLLFEVRAFDAGVLAAVTALLLAVAALASYVPARRAARVDPVVALRVE